MRFGAQIFESYQTPEEWLAIVRKKGLRAVYDPVLHPEDPGEVDAYRQLCEENDLVIAEVGAWGYSLVHRDPAKREEAFQHAVRQFRLADRLGARTCVNVSGCPVGGRWDGIARENFSAETFRDVVETIRRLIDTVEPQRTTFSLEPMPWMIPDSADSYQQLVWEIDRPAFAVHYDPCNLVATHRDYAENGKQMLDFIRRLGPLIQAVHLKDVLLEDRFNTVILEKQAGQGELDYPALLTALDRLDPDLPVMTEHMELESDSLRAEAYIRAQADRLGIRL